MRISEIFREYVFCSIAETNIRLLVRIVRHFDRWDIWEQQQDFLMEGCSESPYQSDISIHPIPRMKALPIRTDLQDNLRSIFSLSN